MDHVSHHDRGPRLAVQVRRWMELGEYHGAERTFEERYAAFAAQARALPLREAGEMILGFMEASVQHYEPLLRAINDLGLLADHARSGEKHEWRPVAARVREQLVVAGFRYQPHEVHHAVANLHDVLQDAVSILEERAT